MAPIEKLRLVPFEEWEMTIAPKWAYFTRPANWELPERKRLEAMQAYFATIMFLDANIGKLLDAVKKMGLEDRTTVVFWSDHGYGLGEHGQWMKQTVFEYAARSPLMLGGAGIKSRGKVCARTVEFLDIYPTLTDICGIKETPAHLHGRSLRPLLDNPASSWIRPAITQVARNRDGGRLMGYSIRTERHRYTMWDDGKEGEELYDYHRDPRELKNLARVESASALKKSLRSTLDTVLNQRGKPAA
jgi:uncharacterized sulfatase